MLQMSHNMEEEATTVARGDDLALAAIQPCDVIVTGRLSLMNFVLFLSFHMEKTRNSIQNGK